MKRFALNELILWKNSKYRKPLILRGARQVGKTWLMKEFGKEFRDFVYINFDENKDYCQFFKETKDVFRIIKNLEFATGKKITKDILLIFDEIQECPEALNSLKYFYENTPEIYLISAGSLLGLSLSAGFPVGKVDFIDVNPMSFSEFLYASGDTNLLAYMDEISEPSPIPEAFFNLLLERLKMYLITGGMPESVYLWTKEREIEHSDRALLNILYSYESDFGKHLTDFTNPSTSYDIHKIKLIQQSIPGSLAKDRKKFLYSNVKKGARAREYETNLEWLVNANLVKKVKKISKPALPLAAYSDPAHFKLYHLDVGLLRRQSKLNYQLFLKQNSLFSEFKGALTENFVMQSLNTLFKDDLYFWADEKYEVDFILQINNDIYPIEVKSGKNVASPSLNFYKKLYSKNTPLVIRYSLNNLSLDGNVLNIPLFLIDKTKELIDLANEKDTFAHAKVSK